MCPSAPFAIILTCVHATHDVVVSPLSCSSDLAPEITLEVEGIVADMLDQLRRCGDYDKLSAGILSNTVELQSLLVALSGTPVAPRLLDPAQWHSRDLTTREEWESLAKRVNEVTTSQRRGAEMSSVEVDLREAIETGHAVRDCEVFIGRRSSDRAS